MPRRPNKRCVAKSARPIAEQASHSQSRCHTSQSCSSCGTPLTRTDSTFQLQIIGSSHPPFYCRCLHSSHYCLIHPYGYSDYSDDYPPSTSGTHSRPTYWTSISHPGKSYLLDIGQCVIECPSRLALHWMQELSTKGTQRRPSFSTCCADGAIHLPPLLDVPPYLQYLLSRRDHGTLQMLGVG
jgi:hypothetical protein